MAGAGLEGPHVSELLLDLLDGLVALASPAGLELPAASWLAERLGALEPELAVTLDVFDGTRANLVWGAGEPPESGGLLLYGHLDTSLSGDAALDAPVTAGRPRLGRLEQNGDLLSGPGVAVAKGPAVAAAVGLLAAHRRNPRAASSARLLLAAGGTHRVAPPFVALPERAPAGGAGAGIRRYLAGHRPAGAVVAKAGPPTVLLEEPGAAMLSVAVRGREGLVMARSEAVRDGGIPATAGAAVRGVERYRKRLLARPLPAGSSSGRELGVGTLTAGLPYKPDLIAGLLVLGVYAVLAPGDDVAELASGLADELRHSLAEGGGAAAEVVVTVLEWTPAAATAATAPIARVARAVWEQETGRPPPELRCWTGSTDGVLLRAAGVDTVRLGPEPVVTSSGDEAVTLSSLLTAAACYSGIVLGAGAPIAASTGALPPASSGGS